MMTSRKPHPDPARPGTRDRPRRQRSRRRPGRRRDPRLHPPASSCRDGFQPEGIAIGRRPDAYVGSLADGDIYSGRACAPARATVIQPGRRHARQSGMKVDGKGRLWVAGGGDGDAKVVNLRTGRSLAALRPRRTRPPVLHQRRGPAPGEPPGSPTPSEPVLYRVAPRAGQALRREGPHGAAHRRLGRRSPTSSTPTASAPRRTAAPCWWCSRSPASCSGSTRPPGRATRVGLRRLPARQR